MRRIVERTMAVLRVLEGRLVAVITLTMVALYGFNVAVRELVPSFASRVAWIDEATRIALVWAVFLALGLALERGRHVAMSTLLEKLPPAVARAVGRAINVTGFLFSIYIAKLSVDLTVFVLNTGQISPTLGVSMAWLYAGLPIGFGLLALRFLLELAGTTNRFEVRAATGERPL